MCDLVASWKSLKYAANVLKAATTSQQWQQQQGTVHQLVCCHSDTQHCHEHVSPCCVSLSLSLPHDKHSIAAHSTFHIPLGHKYNYNNKGNIYNNCKYLDSTVALNTHGLKLINSNWQRLNTPQLLSPDCPPWQPCCL